MKKPLSKEEQEARKPLPPEVLANALTDRVHRDVGHGRAAKVVRHDNGCTATGSVGVHSGTYWDGSECQWCGEFRPETTGESD